ncbi:hypothetical protein AB0D59_13425 [Streptomyces sp. NPDC048417]|uniref:hypothetical protein n=1 Tax=Streptomyces sp. NPDC048417 TaxID=3155387 RepID=UPI00342BA85B
MDAHVGYLDLPGGPASMGETVRTPSPESGLPPTPLLQVHTCLPHPDHKRMAVLPLSTTAEERRVQYRAILHSIAELTSFESPLDEGQKEQ